VPLPDNQPPDSATAPVWLLTGDRHGEVAQQRAVGRALGVPVREIQVARLAAAGGKAQLDLSALQPPFPEVAISFGKTLRAALHVRETSGGHTRIVHMGRPRGVDARTLDLIIPMPHDVMFAADNVLDIRMPFNFPDATSASVSEAETRLRASNMPRPWTVLIIGGVTSQTRFDMQQMADVIRSVCARAHARGGSMLVSTSPRTPADSIPQLRAAMDGTGEFYAFAKGDPQNPLAAYLQLADEIVVTGDSASMIAECWRSGRPLLVAPVHYTLSYRLRSGLRNALPRRWVQSGHVRGSSNINRWLKRLAGAGLIGLLGRSEPSRPYDARDDDDLQRAAARIRALIEQ
jgi:mitochondrial fission protein ELM1